MTVRWGQLNVRAFVSIALIVVWGAVLVATGAFDPAGQTPPSQFDYDGGSVPPSADDRAVATAQAVAMIAALPVAVLALCIAASALRLWKEQVSAIIATSVASLSTLVSIGLAWIGIGTLVFFT
ncbi:MULTISPECIES: hypothetical protein [unclassified Curtobacterium]|uniref:hypothetical protein n=1 Tax=unclassified Curtobacterium TaxID=257496 RepID=UPI00381A5815